MNKKVNTYRKTKCALATLSTPCGRCTEREIQIQRCPATAREHVLGTRYRTRVKSQ